MAANVDEYIASFPEDGRVVLSEIRRRLHAAVPGAEEAISYQIPALRAGGRNVVYFAGWKRHVSLYPIPTGDEALERDMAPYRAGKGTLKFPLDAPVPYDLVERVAARLAAQRAAGER